MTSDLARYVVNPGPKAAVTGLKAAVTTDSSVVTETMVNVLEFHNALRENGVTSVLNLSAGRARHQNLSRQDRPCRTDRGLV